MAVVTVITETNILALLTALISRANGDTRPWSTWLGKLDPCQFSRLFLSDSTSVDWDAFLANPKPELKDYFDWISEFSIAGSEIEDPELRQENANYLADLIGAAVYESLN